MTATRRRAIPRALTLTVTACASLLTACESGTCTFLGTPPYVVPRVAQGATVEFPFSVYAKSEGMGGGELLPSIVDFLLPPEAEGVVHVSPNPLEVSPTQPGRATFTATRAAAPGIYTIEASCRPQGIQGDVTRADFVVEVDAANFFSIRATPSAFTLPRNAIVSASIDILRDAGFNDPVSFSVSGVPAGAAVGMNQGPTTGTSIGLNFSAGSAAPGTYPVTITATGAGRTRAATITVEILADVIEVDWTLSATPTTIYIPPGSSGQIQIALTRTNFPAEVEFFVDFLPATFPIAFAPPSTTGNASVLTVTVPPGTPLGPMPFAIRALVNTVPAPLNFREIGIALIIGTPPPTP